MKKKKKLKGMTLIEIIISLAIFAMLGVVLVQVGTLIDNTNKATARLNKRVNAESPYAASQNDSYDYDRDAYGNIVYDGEGNPVYKKLTPENMNITVSIDDLSGPKMVNVQVKKSDGTYETKQVEAKIDMTAKRYNTRPIVVGQSNIHDSNGPNSNHDLKFAVLDDTVSLSTLTFTLGSDDSPKTISDAYGYTLSGATWESSDNSIATVSATGEVTPHAAGQCEITAQKDGLIFVTTVTVV